MNKEEWIWVAIRVFGVYLVVLAVIAIPDVVSAIYTLSIMPDFGFGSSQAKLENPDEMKFFFQMIELQKANGIKSFCEFLLFSSVGFYFLKGGKLIHGLVSK